MVQRRAARTLVFVDLESTSTWDDGDGLHKAVEQAAAVGRDVVPVPCSLRTRAELERSLREQQLQVPYIVEGGNAACIPQSAGVPVRTAADGTEYERLEFGRAHADVVRILREEASRLGIGVRGFTDMSVEAVAEARGVPLLAARLATLREYTEPFVYTQPNAPDIARLSRAVHAAGLSVREHDGWWYAGGTMSYQPAVRALRRRFQRDGQHVVTAGLGGADGWLRRAVDQYVVVPTGGARPFGSRWLA